MNPVVDGSHEGLPAHGLDRDGIVSDSSRGDEEVRHARHVRATNLTLGTVRRLDNGPTPDRHPTSVKWLDERHPRPLRVEGGATPVAEELCRRLHEAPIGRDPHRSADGRSGVDWLHDWLDDAERDVEFEWLSDADLDVAAGVRLPAARTGRSRRRRNGPEANARLTGMTAAVLFVLLAIEGITVLRIGPLLSAHVFIGMLLIPIVLLKIGIVMWRFAKYHPGDPAYRRRGAPPPLLRLLAPMVVVLTLAVLGTGVALLLVSRALRTELLTLHKVTFVLWLIVMAVHVLAHLLDTARLAPRDSYWRTRRQITGAGLRRWIVATAVVVGLIVGAVMVPHVGTWLGGDHSGRADRFGAPRRRRASSSVHGDRGWRHRLPHPTVTVSGHTAPMSPRKLDRALTNAASEA